NAFGGYDEGPVDTSSVLGEFAASGFVNIVGGCCGTTPAHISAVAGAVDGIPPRVPPHREPILRLSGLEPLNFTRDINFVNIGERTNVTGSARFRDLIKAGDYTAALAVARQQVEAGAQVIDVNMAEGMLDGVAAMDRILTEQVGFPAEDIIFDPNIFAVATGIEAHNNYGVDYIEATRWIKEHLPRALISGGVSNVSFSFRGNNAVREAIHSVFLSHA